MDKYVNAATQVVYFIDDIVKVLFMIDFLSCIPCNNVYCFFFFQAEDGIRDHCVTGVQTCALPISIHSGEAGARVHPDRHDQRLQHRSEEHTSELQSHSDLVCRLLLEKKKKKT